MRADLEQERLVGDGIGEDMVVRSVHPRGTTPFHGAPIPDARRAAASALAAARAMRRTPFVGWDIALDEDGAAIVLEGNSSPGLTPLQRTHGGMASALVRGLVPSRECAHR